MRPRTPNSRKTLGFRTQAGGRKVTHRSKKNAHPNLGEDKVTIEHMVPSSSNSDAMGEWEETEEHLGQSGTCQASKNSKKQKQVIFKEDDTSAKPDTTSNNAESENSDTDSENSDADSESSDADSKNSDADSKNSDADSKNSDADSNNSDADSKNSDADSESSSADSESLSVTTTKEESIDTKQKKELIDMKEFSTKISIPLTVLAPIQRFLIRKKVKGVQV